MTAENSTQAAPAASANKSPDLGSSAQNSLYIALDSIRVTTQEVAHG